MKKILGIILFFVSFIIIIACSESVNPTLPSNIETSLIPAGTFRMGYSGIGSGQTEEIPGFTVTLTKSIYISKYEVTQQQWKMVMGTDPSYFKCNNFPVEMVGWYSAVEFCNKLSEKDGLKKCYIINSLDVNCNWDANGWRLPTEAEWEYAYKAGTTTDFYNGNQISYELDTNLGKIGWYSKNSDKQTHLVGQKLPNAYGIYDMSGNVMEWCWDCFEEYPVTATTDPKGASIDSPRLLRGGSWMSSPSDCKSINRSRSWGSFCNNSTGFRICRNKE